MDDRVLIEQAQQMNKSALSELFKMHYKTVYGYLIKLTYDQTLAEDLTQETMIKAMVNIKSFKFKSQFSSWLLAIATNLYKNYIKKNKRIVLQEDMSFLDQIEVSPSIEGQVLVNDQFKKVMSVLKTFKDQQRIPFILKHYYGYSYDEIAIILKIPIGTVRSRIHNTIKKLQKSLKEYAYEV
jgi:RNA polymerase sigma-70 factor (ECF subfamily)